MLVRNEVRDWIGRTEAVLNNVENKKILKGSFFFSPWLFNSIEKCTKILFHENTEHYSSARHTLYISLSLKFANVFTSYDHPLNLSSSLINLKKKNCNNVS